MTTDLPLKAEPLAQRSVNTISRAPIEVQGRAATVARPRAVLLLASVASLTLELAQQVFQGEDAHILRTSDAEEALRYLATENCDLLLIEFNLPGVNVAQLCERARRIWDGQIMLIAPQERRAEFLPGLTHGGDACLTTPYHPKELFARAQALWRRWDNV